jgi:hypothetical protein
MIVLQIAGYIFLLVASISSSVSMNFQKLAQYETNYYDPRTRKNKRSVPLKTTVFLRPLFIIAIFLSIAASTLDFMALTWLPPSTVGVFGSSSIIINLLVTRVILFEKPSKEEWTAIAYVILGCLLSISVTPDHGSGMPVPELLDRPISHIYIVSNWVLFLLFAVALEYMNLPKTIQRFGYPFIGGALGAQNVCMGKYIAYGVSTISDNHLTVRADNFAACTSLCLASIILHVFWLNKGLEKHDAYFCIIIYQTAWFMFTTFSGIVVYDDMSVLSTEQQVIFVLGLLTAVYGVKRISVIHKESVVSLENAH